MLTQDDFQPVTLSNRDFFQQHYAHYPQTHSDNTLTNMVCWNHYAHYQYAFVEKNVILASTIDGITRFRPPIGPREPALLRSLIKLASDVSDAEPVVLIDPDTAIWIREICPGLNLVPDRNHFEYVYLASDLAVLPGKQYLTIRHHLNKFRKNCRYSVERITADNHDEVKRFLIQWCEWKGCEGDPMLAHEKDATFFAIDHFVELGLSGVVIRVHDTIGAMSLFEPLNNDTALVHFEKGMPDCEGIYKEINAETATILKKDFVYINRESDLGVAGLRESKMRYHPDHMVEVYSIKRDS
ncbi:MAG: phosphatidylglycerol lysyltransferase domain-containing protein [Methanomicrobiales archaeon]